MKIFSMCGLTPPRKMDKEGLCAVRHNLLKIDMIQAALEKTSIPPKANILKEAIACKEKEGIYWFFIPGCQQLHFVNLYPPHCIYVEVNLEVCII